MNFISSLFQSPSTRLFQAIQNDDVETVKKILKPLQGNKDKIKSVFNSQDKESGHTPLQAAIQRNHCSLVKALLDGGANPNECYEMSKSCALVAAVVQKNVDLVLTMLAGGAEVNNTGDDGITALMQACQQKNIKLVEVLLEHKAEVNGLNRGGYCALSIATRSQAFDIADMLLAHEAQLEVQNMFRMTPLIICASDNQLASVKYLIGKGANPLATENRGLNSFHLSVQYGFEDLVKYFLEELHFDVNTGPEPNMPPTIMVASTRLVRPGPNMPPIIMVASTRHVSTAKLLIDHHAKLDVCNHVGTTPLMLACSGQQLAMVQLFVERGCDVHAVDQEGKTCLDYAQKYNRQSIIDFLKDTCKMAPST